MKPGSGYRATGFGTLCQIQQEHFLTDKVDWQTSRPFFCVEEGVYSIAGKEGLQCGFDLLL